MTFSTDVKSGLGSGMLHELRANARRALLEARNVGGYWEGHLSSSALATATAVTALAAARRARVANVPCDQLIARGIEWLVATRNPDGGWGDTPDSRSNISTTALVWAALTNGAGPQVESAAIAAESWIAAAAGGSDGATLASALTRQYGGDRTFSIPILTMCAIAGRLGPEPDAWGLIPRLPFELAVLPRRFFRWLRLPVVSYALPALITMGLARHRQGASAPGLHLLRECSASRALRALEGLQPEGGGFLEAVPLTSFVAISLIAANEARHPVVAPALDFIGRSVRDDWSWPIDTNLATWVTTLSISALGAGSGLNELSEEERAAILRWLLRQQGSAEHPYTGAAPGGWAWTDLPGGVPDADDTAGALLALWHLGRDDPAVRSAASAGVRWLIDLQNREGGIPTFCRGWGALPFDRSGTDLTAHALRAWAAWHDFVDPALRSRVRAAMHRAVSFLASAQRTDGAFVPLWFGNQWAEREENPVYGTSRVLAGMTAAEAITGAAVRGPCDRAARWLLAAQNGDGGWGAGPAVPSNVEETALAITALAAPGSVPDLDRRRVLLNALRWLDGATDTGRRFSPSPIGLYFARLWYGEALYPAIFTVAACETACDAAAGLGFMAETREAL